MKYNKINNETKEYLITTCITFVIALITALSLQHILTKDPHALDNVKNVANTDELINVLGSKSHFISINITEDFELTEKCVIPDGKSVTFYSDSPKQITADASLETMFFVQGKLSIEDNVLINGSNNASNHNADTIIVDTDAKFYLDGGSICQSATNGIYGAEGSKITVWSGNIYDNMASGIESYGETDIFRDGKIYDNNDYGIKIGKEYDLYGWQTYMIQDSNSFSNNLPDNIYIGSFN